MAEPYSLPAPVTIAVVMPHIDGRNELFEQAVDSVRAQTRQPDQFLIEYDPERIGASAVLNRALPRIESEWIAQMADDDFMLPNHLAVLEAHATADVIWPDCLMVGREHLNLCREFDADHLRRDNYIPGGGSLIRTSAARAVGGWCKPGDPDWHEYEDWVMWKRILANGGTFRHIHEVTWGYRFGAHQTAGRPL